MAQAPQHPAGIHLFLGPDRDTKRTRIKELMRALGVQVLDRHEINARDLSAGSLLALAREHPAASPVRLIVVDEAHRLDRAAAQAILSFGEALAQTACLVFMAESEVGDEHPLAALKALAAVERFGPARQSAGSQAGKPGSGFALVEAIARRNASEALQVVQEQLSAGREPLELIGLIAWQLNRWLTVSHLLQAGASRERIGAVAGLQPWLVERTCAELRGRSTRALRHRLERCWELDVAAKTGRAIPRLALEELVVSLCLPEASRQPPAAPVRHGLHAA